MEITDRAIILKIDKFQEQDALVSMFCREAGLLRGLAKRALTNQHRGTYYVGNWVDVRWHARLEEHLGTVECDLHMPVGAMAMHDRLKCYALQSMCALILLSIEERDPHPRLFMAVDKMMEASQFDGQWLSDLVRFELILLQEAGYGLALDECVVTGQRDNLTYISPKSGCAVSAEAGAAYRERLFAYPECMRKNWHDRAAMDDIREGLRITQYFMDKWLMAPFSKPIPPVRERLLMSLHQAELVS